MAEQRTMVRREWADLKSVAGTGQAVGFGYWIYIAGFASLQPDVRPTAPSGITLPMGGPWVDMRVRPASEAPANPAPYITNVGVVKLTEPSHATVIKALRDAR